MSILDQWDRENEAEHPRVFIAERPWSPDHVHRCEHRGTVTVFGLTTCLGCGGVYQVRG